MRPISAPKHAYIAFDPNGVDKGKVKLDWIKKAQWEKKGWTFRRLRGSFTPKGGTFQ